jgi:hypothetical protein
MYSPSFQEGRGAGEAAAEAPAGSIAVEFFAAAKAAIGAIEAVKAIWL